MKKSINNKVIRNKINNIGTIWISGVSVSGKTTLGKLLYDDLIKYGIKNVKFMDGDDLRKKQNKQYGHSLSERYELLHNYIKIVKTENINGNIIIISTVSHKRDMRQMARKLLESFFEINLICSPKVCAERDIKNIYSSLDIENNECLPGVTEPYEISENAELIIDTGKNSVNECKDILFKKVINFLN